MAYSPACRDVYKGGPCRFLASSRYGATSASVEADATQNVPRYSLTEDTPKPPRSLISSFVSCDMPLIPFSSPEHSPAASSILSPPVTSQHSTDNVLSAAAVPWLQYPAHPSRSTEGYVQKYNSEHGSNCKTSIFIPSSYAKSTSYAGQRLVLPTLAEPSAEDCTSDSSVSTAGDATDTAPSRWLKNASTETTQGVAVGQGLHSPTKYEKLTAKRVTVRQLEDCPTKDDASSSFSACRDSNTAQTASPSWTPQCEKTIPGGLHTQWNATESSKEQVSCHSLGDSPAICESLETFGSSARLAKAGGVMRCGSGIPSVEDLDDADDGRAWLDHLEKLRGGAPKEEYKRERSRVVDALIRRAATYPKVSGIYFDKHQLRWSVGWAHNGRRAAKYFPVKLFGMREGYDMAVSFKSTKTVPLEPSTPLLANPVQAADGPASSVKQNESTSNRPLLTGVPSPQAEKALVSFAPDVQFNLSLQPQSAIVGTTSLCSRTWQERTRIHSPCFPEMPLAVLATNSQASSDTKIAEAPRANTARTAAQLSLCSTDTAVPVSQRVPYTAGSDKEENIGQTPDDHASAPSSPGRPTAGELHGLTCFRSFSSMSEMDHLKLSGPCIATSGKPESHSALESRLIASEACYVNRTHELMPQIPGMLVSAPPFAPHHPHGSGQTEDSAESLCCRNSLELCGVDNNIEANVSVVSVAPRFGNRDSMLLVGVFVYLQRGTSSWPSLQVHERNALGPAQDGSKYAGLPFAMKMIRPLCNSFHGVSSCHSTYPDSLPATNDRRDVVSSQHNSIKANIQETELSLGKTVRYDRLRMQHFQQMHHTPGIHFDKHSLRWKATCRLLAIHTRLTNHIPRGSRYREKSTSDDLALQILPQQGSDIPFGQSSSCGATADSFPENNATADSSQGEHPNIQHHNIVSSSVLAMPNPLGSAVNSSSNCELTALSSLTDGAYDEERDRRLSKAPSRVLIRHASRLTRVPGIWFDKKQLRWACTFTDVESGKRRAEYFPIRHFGFLGARLLAVNARRKMERFRSQASANVHSPEKCKKEDAIEHDLSASRSAEGTAGEVDSFESHRSREAGVQDLWNKYVVEILQRKDASKGHHFSTTDGIFFGFSDGPLQAVDELMCSETGWDRGNLLKTHSETILSLGREAIRFLLFDLRTHCLSGLASGLSPRESIFHMTVLHQHALWVEKIEHCQSLEQYLTIFANCIKHMKLPSHLCQAEQRRLLRAIAALATPPSTDQ
ncbi:hypothetical protein, conserved [Eimeria brunetti]|uniref:AP2/ERF domain-containing protein n=1 Tax=Eimeria brunetti TaxID=51314 RepID=U6LYG6_9EIME|nr:hypothetical protein, conserved [Eimeria brunetti]